jgi:hypothetical protein
VLKLRAEARRSWLLIGFVCVKPLLHFEHALGVGCEICKNKNPRMRIRGFFIATNLV